MSSRSLIRIEKSFREFCSKVEDCRNDPKTDEIMDAYSRLTRLRERVKKGFPTLGPTANAALYKVFFEDHFIESMCKCRAIGDHVKTDNAFLYDIDNVAFPATSTAGAVFREYRVQLPDTSGQPHYVDHIINLTKAKDRIAKALSKARGE